MRVNFAGIAVRQHLHVQNGGLPRHPRNAAVQRDHGGHRGPRHHVEALAAAVVALVGAVALTLRQGRFSAHAVGHGVACSQVHRGTVRLEPRRHDTELVPAGAEVVLRPPCRAVVDPHARVRPHIRHDEVPGGGNDHLRHLQGIRCGGGVDHGGVESGRRIGQGRINPPEWLRRSRAPARRRPTVFPDPPAFGSTRGSTGDAPRRAGVPRRLQRRCSYLRPRPRTP